eukprot:6267939-Alexandrium_andersonii.AAC.1
MSRQDVGARSGELAQETHDFHRLVEYVTPLARGAASVLLRSPRAVTVQGARGAAPSGAPLLRPPACGHWAGARTPSHPALASS